MPLTAPASSEIPIKGILMAKNLQNEKTLSKKIFLGVRYGLCIIMLSIIPATML